MESKSSRKDAALSFLQLIVSGRIREAYAKHVGPGMRHHNPSFAGDVASLERAMEENHGKFPDKILSVKHALEDGDFVALHSHLQLQAGKPGIAAVHLFRFDGELIVEMWDIGQPVPNDSPNKNGMF